MSLSYRRIRGDHAPVRFMKGGDFLSLVGVDRKGLDWRIAEPGDPHPARRFATEA